ncbi:MAG: toll/interleukin-1 receptor domain-containing protein [Phycisphaerales bacterium]|nr:MAG: toll/interleukin-1 receptor domain-containing protein [Phycisphaerales bacterium]
MPNIFISYSSLDNAPAERFKQWLDERGFEQIFLDFGRYHGIPPGEGWERRRYSELNNAAAVVLLLSRRWFDSKRLFAESTHARALG